MPGSRNLIWLPKAVLDLKRLDDFLRPKNEQAANNASLLLLEAADALSQNPEIGPLIDPSTNLRKLFIPFGKQGYILYYSFAEETVTITNVWHTRERRKG